MNNMDDKGHWYNFKTGELEYIETPTDFTDYISQNVSAQALYNLELKLGEHPMEAARTVLMACISGRQG